VIAPEVLAAFALMLLAIGAVGMSLYTQHLDHKRRDRIMVLETELKLANAIVDSVAPPVADQADR
jgi:hypothetical protein